VLLAKRQYEGIRFGLAIARVRSVHTQNSPSQNIGPLKTINRHHPKTQIYNQADKCESKGVETSRFSAIHLQQLTGGNIIHRFYILSWQGRTPSPLYPQ
jgi:hypothetical protein